MSIFGFTKKFIARPKLLLGAAVVMTSMTASLPAFAANWLKCADRDGICSTVSSGDKYTIRYGANGVYSYTQFLYMDGMKCDELSFRGDPVYGVHKTCEVYPDHLTTLKLDGATLCGTEGQLCTISADAMHWVYYGDPSPTGSKVAAIKYGSFMCNVASFGLDPARRIGKACYIGPRVYTPTPGLPPTWKLCAASEGQICKFSGDDSFSQVVIRYGASSKWTFRLITAAPDTSFKCHILAFEEDPAPGVNKSCSYIPLTATVKTSSGVWNKLASCGGKNCVLEYAMSNGTELTRGSEFGHSWSASVAGSVGSSGLNIINAGISVEYNYTQSLSFNHSVTKSNLTQTVTKCPGFAYGATMYQFAVPTTVSCLSAGICSATTYTTDFFCSPNSSTGANPTPKCLPNKCNATTNKQCQVCSL